METSSTLETPAVFRRGRNLQLVGERTEQTPQSPNDAARTAAVAKKEAELAAALATVRTAFAILGSRALVILSACGAVASFAAALYWPDGLRLTAACLYTVLVFLPSLYASRV